MLLANRHFNFVWHKFITLIRWSDKEKMIPNEYRKISHNFLRKKDKQRKANTDYDK